MNYWLLKTEPNVYSWNDLELEGKTAWTGVRNYEARNNMLKMRLNDEAIIYHTYEERACVGIAVIVSEAYNDPLVTGTNWMAVDVSPTKLLPRPVALWELRETEEFKTSKLLTNLRLSIVELSESQFNKILSLSAQLPIERYPSLASKPIAKKTKRQRHESDSSAGPQA